MAILSRRLLNKNVAAAEEGDLCPRRGCRCAKLGTEMLLQDLNKHLEHCVCGGKEITDRHNTVLQEVREMLEASGAYVNPISPTLDPIIQAKLRDDSIRRGVPLPQRTRWGNVKGGDLTYNYSGELPEVLDMRIVVEGADKYKDAESPATQAEAEKRTKYAQMYKHIQYDFRGVAVELGGRIGDGLVELIEKCAEKADPAKFWELPGVSYATPTFFSYWNHRIVLAAQRANAGMINGISMTMAYRRGQQRNYVPPAVYGRRYRGQGPT
jgi:hypothetical protein